MKTFLGLVTVLLVACGGGGSSAEDKCNDIIDVTCDRVIDCINPAPTHSDCVAQVKGSLDCGSAKKVGPTYNSCMDHLNNDTCDVLFPPDGNGNPQLELPQDCVGVIMTARLAPEPNSSPLLEETDAIASQL